MIRFSFIEEKLFFTKSQKYQVNLKGKLNAEESWATYRLHKCFKSCLVFHFTSWETAKAQTCKLSLKVSGKRENSVTTWMIPHKGKNSCSISWSSILMWSSRTRQPDSTGSLQSFSEFGILASVKRLLKLGVSTHEALQWCTAQKAFLASFHRKTQTAHEDWGMILLSGSGIQTMLSLTALCPYWLLTCETGAIVPFGNVLPMWNCCEQANDYYLLLLTVGTPKLGNLRDEHVDVWPRRKLNSPDPPDLHSWYGAWEMGSNTLILQFRKSLCSNWPQP